jgi:hypothetical protein
MRLLDEHLAAPWLEIEARIADIPWGDSGQRVDPHHLSTARVDLERATKINAIAASSRGGREVTILQPVGGRRATAIDKATARKRLLLTRYLGWSHGSPSRPGLIGPAAERVVHASLIDSGTFQIANPQGGQTRRFLGYELDGALDNAAIYTPLIDGLPQQPVAVAIEVKNMRDWVYPVSEELYQILDKAAQLQRARPESLIVPRTGMSACSHHDFSHGEGDGVFIVQTRRQYISSVDESGLGEVRAELGFLDLVSQTGTDPKVARLFSRTFTAQAANSASKWQRTASDAELGALLSRMRHTSSVRRRQRILHELRALVGDLGMDEVGGW